MSKLIEAIEALRDNQYIDATDYPYLHGAQKQKNALIDVVLELVRQHESEATQDRENCHYCLGTGISPVHGFKSIRPERNLNVRCPKCGGDGNQPVSTYAEDASTGNDEGSIGTTVPLAPANGLGASSAPQISDEMVERVAMALASYIHWPEGADFDKLCDRAALAAISAINPIPEGEKV